MTPPIATPRILPTSVVGSHGLPGWVWLAREAMEAGRLGALDVRELMEDATQVALLDQERAGVDVISTGEMMRVRFIIGFYDRITGHPRAAPAAPARPAALGHQHALRGAWRRSRRRRGWGSSRSSARPRAHRQADQGYRAGSLHPARAPQARRRLSRQGHAPRRPRGDRQRGVPRAGGGGRRVHPDRRAASRHVLGHGARGGQGHQPRGGGRGRQDRRPRLLRQSLRPPFQRGARLPQRVPDAGRAARLADRARVRQRGDGRIRRAGRTSPRTRSWARASSTSRRSRRRPPRTSPSASARSSPTSRPSACG